MILLSGIIVLFIYSNSLANSIYGGDAGDLVSAIITKGFAHPPGYSLYTLLGTVFNSFSFLHLTSAGRITWISTLSTVLSFIVLYKIINLIFKQKYYNPVITAITILVLSFSYIVWLYAIVPEVFPLNTLITLIFFYAALQYYQTRNNFYLYILSLLLGFALSHQYTFLLVIPSVFYLFWKLRSKLHAKVSSILIPLIFFLIGLSPNLQMFFATKQHASVTWGSVTNIQNAVSVLLRQGYGTFTAGAFITNFPEHRLLQLKNLFLYFRNDFTYLGIIVCILSIFEYLRLKDSKMKLYLNALLINLFFFGPFFFFYANFPLGTAFFFATLERFLHIFYFFLGIFIYFGIWSLYSILKAFLNHYLSNLYLKKLAYACIIILFFIYPIGQYTRNFRVLAELRNDTTAESLGLDVLNNVPQHSIILLSGDTILFDTQYVYYSNANLSRNKILIHTSKLLTDYYRETLQHNFPKLRFNAKDYHSLEYFIDANKENFSVYSNSKYPLTALKEYSWIPEGLLYKLVRNSDINTDDIIRSISKFWSDSYNKNLVSRIKNNDLIFKNLFLADILRIYGIVHENTAYYFLQNNAVDQALIHINEAIILQPDDADNHFLKSRYYEAKKDCHNAETEINSALKGSSDDLYIQELKALGEKCYDSENDKSRIETKIKELEKDKTIRLRSF